MQTRGTRGHAFRLLSPQSLNLARQQINLLLLTNHHQIQLLQQVLSKAGLDFQGSESAVSIKISGNSHAGIVAHRGQRPRPRVVE